MFLTVDSLAHLYGDRHLVNIREKPKPHHHNHYHPPFFFSCEHSFYKFIMILDINPHLV